MSGTAFTVHDRSQRYSKPASLMLTDLLVSAKVASLIPLSEAGGGTALAKRRKGALHKVPGFDVHQDIKHGDADEIAILSEADEWQTVYYEATILGPDLGPGGREIAGILIVRNARTGALLLLSKAHLPASVERDFYHSARGTAYRKCVQVWRARVKALAKKYGVDAQLVYADWNLDLHKPWVRDYIKKAWPELDLPPRIPKWSTHAGGRLIDFFLYDGLTVKSWAQLPDSDASDHRGTELDAEIPSRKDTTMTWRLAESLDALRDEVNARWPNRSKVSDGTIGDAAHASRDSDHNPWVKDGTTGVVTAMDVTDDGNIAEVIVATLVKRRDPRVKYLIHNRQIWRSYDKPGIPAWTPAPYTGDNPHLKHVHVSVNSDKADYDSRAPWGIKVEKQAPTVHITKFKNSRSHPVRRAEAALVAEKGSPEARAAAKAYLAADADLVKKARALIALEVK